MKAEGQIVPSFILPPSSFILDFSGRDSSRQNGDCQGAWSSKRRVGLTPRPLIDTEIRRHGDTEKNSRRVSVSPRLRVAHVMARVPGIGLLNRTCKSWVERHEVQLLRGLPFVRMT